MPPKRGSQWYQNLVKQMAVDTKMCWQFCFIKHYKMYMLVPEYHNEDQDGAKI